MAINKFDSTAFSGPVFGVFAAGLSKLIQRSYVPLSNLKAEFVELNAKVTGTDERQKRRSLHQKKNTTSKP